MSGMRRSPNGQDRVRRTPATEPGHVADGDAEFHPPSWIARDLPLVGWALAGLRRHKWTAAGVWLAVTAAGAAWVSRLPSVYQSEAVVLVESHRIPERLVPVSLDRDLEGRFERARQKLLSALELQAIIRRLNLYPGERGAGITVEALAGRLRRSVAIGPAGAGARERWGPIRVTSTAPDADTAARVANELAWRLIQGISQDRRSTSEAAAQFLSTHVTSVRRELDLREAALREFRLRHSDELPEQSESLRATARRLRAELTSLRDEIGRLEREKQVLDPEGRTARHEPATGPQPGPALAPSPLTNGPGSEKRSQTDQLRKRLAELLAVYRPEHPDVRRVRAQLAHAESVEAESPARPPLELKSNGIHPELPRATSRNGAARARQIHLEVRLEALATRRLHLAAELGAVEERLRRVPLRQQELAALVREQAFLSEQFRSLAARRQSAEMAEALERSYPSERVTLLEPARPPERPAGPKRWAVMAAANLGGLLVGCLLAAVRTLGASAWRRPDPAVSAHQEEEHPSYITA